jgi:hypothetical protein
MRSTSVRELSRPGMLPHGRNQTMKNYLAVILTLALYACGGPDESVEAAKQLPAPRATALATSEPIYIKGSYQLHLNAGWSLAVNDSGQAVAAAQSGSCWAAQDIVMDTIVRTNAPTLPATYSAFRYGQGYIGSTPRCSCGGLFQPECRKTTTITCSDNACSSFTENSYANQTWDSLNPPTGWGTSACSATYLYNHYTSWAVAVSGTGGGSFNNTVDGSACWKAGDATWTNVQVMNGGIMFATRMCKGSGTCSSCTDRPGALVFAFGGASPAGDCTNPGNTVAFTEWSPIANGSNTWYWVH